MSKQLPSAAETLTHNLAAPGAWLILLEIYNLSGTLQYRLVNNTETVTYDGANYHRASFELHGVDESLKGNLPTLNLSLNDPALSLRTALYNNAGFSGWEIRIRRVYFPTPTTYTDTSIHQYFTIQDTDRDDTGINFSLGAPRPLHKRFPRDRYIPSICRHRFQDGMCRYGLTPGQFTGYTSNRISFFVIDGDIDYIQTCSHALASQIHENMLITISGSSLNDGTYRISTVSIPHINLVLLGVAPPYSLAGEGESATITLRPACDYGLTTCRGCGNENRFGGSPGITEGLYG